MSNITIIRNGSTSQNLVHAVATVAYQHPMYQSYTEIWEKITDVLEGEEAVKAQGQKYLPDIAVGAKCFNASKYNDYKKRAVFTPYASRTVDGFVGTIFRRSVQIEMPKNSFALETVARDTFQVFSRKLGRQIFEKGRAGVFTDYKKVKKRAESEIYCAEAILSWEEDDNGKLIYVLLRDVKETIARPNVKDRESNTLSYSYKSLQIDGNGEYSVTYYDGAMEAVSTTKPLNKNRPLKWIPFVFFGSEDNSPEVDRPPILNIVNLNIAHYHTSALLETGRRYTAFPIYTVPVGNRQEETSAYEISPSVVWETPLDSKPAILEYYGQGLNHLAEALSEKERAIIQLGARAIGLRDIESRYEASSIFELLYQAELALLINVTDLLSEGLREVIHQSMTLSNTGKVPKKEEIIVSVSKEFKTANIASSDIRAIALLAEKNLLPLQEVYQVLKAAELVSGDVSYQEFKLLIDTEKKETIEKFAVEEDIKADAKIKVTPKQDPAKKAQPKQFKPISGRTEARRNEG